MLMLTCFRSLVGRKVSFFQPDDEVVGKWQFPGPPHCPQPSSFCVNRDAHCGLTSAKNTIFDWEWGTASSILAFQK